MELNLNEASFDGRDQFLDFLRSDVGVNQPVNITTSDRVKRLTLSMARPQDDEVDVNNSIGFAVSRGVTHLELNFYHPTRDQGLVIDLARGFRLPEVVYHHHQNLYFLKLTWCNFDVPRLNNFMSLESLNLAWITIATQELRELVASCPILNTLTLRFCNVVNELGIEHNYSTLKNLVVEKCSIGMDMFTLAGPKLRKFIYTGKVAQFRIGNQHELVEARLDFREQAEFRAVPLLCELVDQLVNVRIMSVCSVFLQMIACRNRNDRVLDLNRQYRTVSDLNVQHLTMNTELHNNEFIGSKFLLASCPRMNTLNLRLRPGKILSNYKAPYKVTSHVTVETCLRDSLLVLNVYGFRGTRNQMTFIDYIVRNGRCLRNVNLYLPEQEHYENLVELFEEKASQLGGGASSGGLEISVLTPSFLVNRAVLPPC